MGVELGGVGIVLVFASLQRERGRREPLGDRLRAAGVDGGAGGRRRRQRRQRAVPALLHDRFLQGGDRREQAFDIVPASRPFGRRRLRRRAARQRPAASFAAPGRDHSADVLDEVLPARDRRCRPSSGERSAVWVSSKMIGRLHGAMTAGASVRLRSARVASARTQREAQECGDHSTTTAFEGAQFLLDHFIEGLARMERSVPPDSESLLRESLGKTPGHPLVFASIGNEDVRSVQSASPTLRLSAGIGSLHSAQPPRPDPPGVTALRPICIIEGGRDSTERAAQVRLTKISQAPVFASAKEFITRPEGPLTGPLRSRSRHCPARRAQAPSRAGCRPLRRSASNRAPRGSRPG